MSARLNCHYCHKEIGRGARVFFSIQYDPSMYVAHLSCRAHKINISTLKAFFRLLLADDGDPLFGDIINERDSFYGQRKNDKRSKAWYIFRAVMLGITLPLGILVLAMWLWVIFN